MEREQNEELQQRIRVMQLLDRTTPVKSPSESDTSEPASPRFPCTPVVNPPRVSIKPDCYIVKVVEPPRSPPRVGGIETSSDGWMSPIDYNIVDEVVNSDCYIVENDPFATPDRPASPVPATPYGPSVRQSTPGAPVKPVDW